MFFHYIKTAFRNLLRQKLFSVINIFGLSLGLTCFILILLYVFNQTQYDKHHSSGEYLHRVETELISGDGQWISATVSPPIVPAMATEFPGVVGATRVVDPPETSHHILKWKDKSFFVTKGFYVDSTFFDLFDYDWIEGDDATALDQPFSIVLTKEVKEKLFAEESAVGKVISINNRFGNNEFKVTGVVDPATHKSHIRPNFYMSMNSGGIGDYVRNSDQWAGGNFIFGYVKIHPETNIENLTAQFPEFLQKYGGTQLSEMGSEKILSLQPVPEIHLFSTRRNQLDTIGNFQFLKILVLIAMFLLIIACINFINLTTAKSFKRGVEVGVRKTIGAGRLDIAKQFYTESFLITGVSIFIAITIASFLLPYMSDFVEESIGWQSASIGLIIAGILGIYLLTALIAGSYPAIFLSSFRPVAVIKGQHFQMKRPDFVRKGLVVLQFVISACLIIGSLVIVNQLRYMQSKDLGIDVRQKIVIPFKTSDSRSKLKALKNEALTLPGVQSAAGARIYPGQFMPQDFNVYTEGSDMEHSNNVKLVQGDEDYLKTLGIPILQGRNFSPNDTSIQILINQTGLKTFGIPEEEAIGKRLFSDYDNTKSIYEIIGVVKDYHQGSLKQAIQSMIFEYRPTHRNIALLINTSVSSGQDIIASLRNKWNENVESTPFEYMYLEDQIQAQYAQETKLAQIISLCTLISILISCLGLFGLASFVAEQRTKEIGIRKILGANVGGIVALISKDFVKLSLLSFAISVPIAYYFMGNWLQDFVYRTEISWMIFVGAGVLLVIFTLVTVSFQSIRAAMANPIESLRTE